MMNGYRVGLIGGGVAATAGLVSAVLFLLERSSSAAAVLGVALSGAALALLGLLRIAEHGLRISKSVDRRVVGARRQLRAQQSLLRDIGESVAAQTSVAEASDQRLVMLGGALSDSRQAAADAAKRVRNDIAAVERTTRQTRLGLRRVQTDLATLPYQAVELNRLYGRLVKSGSRMPAIGGWALTTGTLMELLDEVLTDRTVRSIVECGSGTSTVWLALALESRGGEGSVVALEHEPRFAEETRSYLRAHGVEHRARIVDAPLVPTRLDDGIEQHWYDLSQADLPGHIDLLFVDGPVGEAGKEVRYPAYPLLAAQLSPSALVVLDDTDRAEERQTVERWIAEEPGGVRIEEARRTDRATLMRRVAGR